MPYSEIRGLYPIPDDETILWRYLEPYKFEYLIKNNAIYFTQAEQFPKSFQEGILSKKELEGIKWQIYSTSKKNPEKEYKDFLKHYNNFNKAAFISCWMQSENEADHMWRGFLKNNNGVVIKSSVGKLKSVFNNSPTKFSIYISDTFYYSPNEIIDGVNLIKLFSRKPADFEGEQEVRAIIIDMPYINKPDHYDINIDIDELIDEVRLSPNADENYQNAIQEICVDLKLELNCSELL